MRSVLFCLLTFTAVGQGILIGHDIPSIINNALVTTVIPTGGTTNQVIAQNFVSAPISTGETYPFIIQLRTNQTFRIQDELGNNIFGLSADAYQPGTIKHWCINFGGKQQGLIDQLFDMRGGADIGWRINGDLNNQIFFQTYGAGVGIVLAYANTNYLPDFAQVPILDNYGTIFPTAICGQPIHLNQAAAVGAAAGTGGSLGVVIDSQASDVSVQVTLTTGNAGTTSGTAVTYTTANDVKQFNGIVQPTSFPYKPVGSPANDAASAEFSKVKFTGTTTNVLVSVRSGQALTVNTTYVWNLFLVR